MHKLVLAIASFSLLTTPVFAEPSQMEQDKAQIEMDKHVLATDRQQLEEASKKIQRDREKMTDDEHRLMMDKQNSNGGPKHFWDKKAPPQTGPKATVNVPQPTQPQAPAQQAPQQPVPASQ